MTRPRLLDTAAENLGRTMPPRLSIDGNRFTLIDGSGNEKPLNTLNLDVVFIDLNPKVSKMYFGRDYNPNDTEPPLCWSDNGEAPSSQAGTPQSAKCFSCPHNVIGSNVSKFSGAKIKACVDMKKLAFIVPGDPSELVYLHTIKPGSFKNWSSTVNWLKGQKFQDGASPDLCDVVIRMEFESQGVLKFTPTAPIPGNAALEAQRERAWSKNVTDEIVGKNDVPHSGALAAPASVQQIAPPPVTRETAFQGGPAIQHTPQQGAMPTQMPPPGMQFTTSSPAVVAPVESKKRGRKPAAAAQPAPETAPFLQAQPNPQPAPPAQTPPAQQQPSSASPGQAADPMDIPPFLRRDQQQPAPPAPAQAAQQFGFATPAQPDPAMSEAIAAAFRLPT